MGLNRITVYGHRSWASSAIVRALAASQAPIGVLYRPSSNVSVLLQQGRPLAMSWYLRKLWGTGKQEKLPGYKKTSLEELIVGRHLAG